MSERLRAPGLKYRRFSSRCIKILQIKQIKQIKIVTQRTMTISKEQIIQTAKLARVKLNDNEMDDITQRLSSILELVDQMQAVDTSAVEPMANSLDAVQILRTDQVDEPAEKIAGRNELLEGAPACEDGLFLVPRVID